MASSHRAGSTTPRGKAPKPSELFRERHVTRYHAAIAPLADLPASPPTAASPQSPEYFVAKSSHDAALTAFAQLATLRLDVSRCLISLIDSRNQYVLAEATKTLSLQSDERHGPQDALSLGAVVFPRSQSISQYIVDPTPGQETKGLQLDEDGLLEIHRLQEHPLFATIPALASLRTLQFYAGVPIALADGTRIGVLVIVDDKARPPLSSVEKTFLQDLATTVMGHLEAVRLRNQHQRRYKLVTGIESFIDGLPELRASLMETAPGDAHANSAVLHPAEGERDQERDKHATDTEQADSDHANKAKQRRPLWERALPLGAKSMFSRAATIIRQTGDYDGMVFFYMSSASTERTPTRQHGWSGSPPPLANPASRNTGRFGQESKRSESEISEESSDANEKSKTKNTSARSPGDLCPILSLSLSSKERADRQHAGSSFVQLKHRDLRRLLRTSSRGRIFAFNQYGQPLQGDASSSGSGTEMGDPSSGQGHARTSSGKSQETDSRPGRRRYYVSTLQKLSPDGKAFVCLPLWDFERQRWFAYAICWSNDYRRDLTAEGDLHFLRLFGHSIMNALAHIDASAVDRVKNGLISSISHELRSPLHGLLGATHFLQDSPLNRFQQEMVDAVTASGQTLLDTIDHVMDFAKLNSGEGAGSTTIIPSFVRTASNPSSQADAAQVDVVATLEEVLDSITMGFSVQHEFISPDEPEGSRRALKTSGDSSSQPQGRAPPPGTHKERNVKIAIQIPSHSNWTLPIAPGAWRRIVMNLFANALKYTTRGMIIIRLQILNDDTSSSGSIRFSVTDTGIGMSENFIENHLFKAFSQENSFTAGTGLGLHIVDQAVRSMGGRMNVTSSKGVGSTIGVLLPLLPSIDVDAAPAPNHEIIDSIVQRLRPLRVCSLEDSAILGSDHEPSVERDFANLISELLKDWFGVDLIRTSTWTQETADLILCTGFSFKHLESIRTAALGKPLPPVIIIVNDALEMAVLRTDASISVEGSTIELAYQPVGPYKFAKILQRCLDRRDAQLEAERDNTSTSSPAPPVRIPTHQLPTQSLPSRPLTSVSKPAEAKPEEISSEPSVLIVDDNPLNVKLLATFMRKLAVPCHQAVDGQQSVDLYKRAHAAIKCILMDISMPVMDGITATRCIREFEKTSKLPRAHIVALTGLTSAATRSEAAEAGMDTFLTKPVSFRLLQEKVPLIPTLNSQPSAAG